MATQHSALPRGLETAGKNPGFNTGRFGRMFQLPPATFGKTEQEQLSNLTKLADAMVSSFDPPQDGPDPEESGLPALYTYFGQFIDHDLTFDPDASFQKQKDPEARIDFRTPAFDLDNVYGRGPGDQPYLYDSDKKSFLLGKALTLGSPAGARDLQRNSLGRAMIGDPRNDENSIVSQFQGLMLRLHNKLVAAHPKKSFHDIQALVRHHYQFVVVNDFLPSIVTESVLDALRTDGHFDKSKLAFYTEAGHDAKFAFPYMPVEFSVAAYRLGHSMVRPGYRLNDVILQPIFPLPADETKGQVGLPEGLTGFRELVSNWGIDWNRFVDLEQRAYGTDAEKPTAAQIVQNNRRLQFAYRIDTALVDPLKHLPLSVADNPPDSLALRNLKRGAEFGLPSGQEVAKFMNTPVLTDDKILIGQGTSPLPSNIKSMKDMPAVFAGNCPLWTYILAEAIQHKKTMTTPTLPPKQIDTPQLGPVGGRIVAEVFLGLLFADKSSYLKTNPDWTPEAGKHFKLRDLVAMAF